MIWWFFLREYFLFFFFLISVDDEGVGVGRGEGRSQRRRGRGWVGVCVCVWKRNSVRIEMFFFLDFWKFGIAKKARQKGFGSPSAASFFSSKFILRFWNRLDRQCFVLFFFLV